MGLFIVCLLCAVLAHEHDEAVVSNETQNGEITDPVTGDKEPSEVYGTRPPPATTINLSYYRSRLSALKWAKDNGITLTPDPSQSPIPDATASPRPVYTSETHHVTFSATTEHIYISEAPQEPTMSPYPTPSRAYRTAFIKPSFDDRQELFETNDINFPLPSETPSQSRTPTMSPTNTIPLPSPTPPQPPVICNLGAKFVAPDQCVCENAHVGDGRSVCRPPTPAIHSISPKTAHASGGTIVSVRFTIENDFLPVSAFCKFGRDVVVGTMINDTTVECVAPQSMRTEVALAISFDGENWSRNKPFYYETTANFLVSLTLRLAAALVIVSLVLFVIEKLASKVVYGVPLLDQWDEKHE